MSLAVWLTSQVLAVNVFTTELQICTLDEEAVLLVCREYWKMSDVG